VSTARTIGDPYEELGVARSATREQLTAAFRARAKELHPDARPDDAEAAERFKQLGAAYTLLVDPVQRARYDAGLPLRPGPGGASPSATPAPSASRSRSAAAPPRGVFRFSRRGARWAVGGGLALMVLGLAAGAFVVTLQRHDADLRARGIATVATVVEVHGDRRLEFVTRAGRRVRAVESVKTGEEQPPVGARVSIHYERTDPTNVVTDESHLGRNLTFWIVAVKFLVGGAVLVWFGRRRLRAPA
jgi:hypothetical protein